LLYPEDVEEHYRNEAQSHLEVVSLRLQLERLTSQKNSEVLRGLKKAHKELNDDNIALQRKLTSVEGKLSEEQKARAALEERVRILEAENKTLKQPKPSAGNLALLELLVGGLSSSILGDCKAGPQTVKVASLDVAETPTHEQPTHDSTHETDEDFAPLPDPTVAAITNALDKDLQRIQDRLQRHKVKEDRLPMLQVSRQKVPPLQPPVTNNPEDPWRQLYSDPRTMLTEKQLKRELKHFEGQAPIASRENRRGARRSQYDSEVEIANIRGHLHLRRMARDYIEMKNQVDSLPRYG
jgi:hypothetical protein